jgi:hypothetical protein
MLNANGFRICKTCGIEDPLPPFEDPATVENLDFKRHVTSEVVKGKTIKGTMITGNRDFRGSATNEQANFRLRRTQSQSSKKDNAIDRGNHKFIDEIGFYLGLGGASIKRASTLYDEFVAKHEDIAHRTMNNINKILVLAIIAYSDDKINAGANRKKFISVINEIESISSELKCIASKMRIATPAPIELTARNGILQQRARDLCFDPIVIKSASNIDAKFKRFYSLVNRSFKASIDVEIDYCMNKNHVTRFHDKITKIVMKYHDSLKLEPLVIAASTIVYAVYAARLQKSSMTIRRYMERIMNDLCVSFKEPESFVARRNSVYVIKETAFYNVIFNDEFDFVMNEVGSFLSDIGRANASKILDVINMSSTSINYCRRFVSDDVMNALVQSPIARANNGAIAYSIHLSEIKRAIKDFLKPVIIEEKPLQSSDKKTVTFCVGKRDANRPTQDDRSLNMVVTSGDTELYTHWIQIKNAKEIIRRTCAGATISAKLIRDQMIAAGMISESANPYKAYLIMAFLSKNDLVTKSGLVYNLKATVNEIIETIDNLPVRATITKDKHTGTRKSIS